MKSLQPTSTLDYFVLHGGVRMDTLADLYALDFGELGDTTLSELIRRLRDKPASGDRITLGPLEFVVVDAEDGQIRTAGLRFNASGSERTLRRHTARPRHAQPYNVGRHRLAFPWPKKAGDGPRRSAGA